MIKSIVVKNVATFDDTGVKIDNCKKINFIYGANGCGKTTISNFLSNQSDNKFKDCSINWENENSLPILVYNKNFRIKNFGDSDIAGVFTLGKATKDEIDEINKENETLENMSQEIQKKSQTIKKQNEVIDKLEKDFQEDVWLYIYKENEIVFKESFVGFMNKKLFKDKLLKEYKNCTDIIKTREEVVKDALALFGSPPINLPLLPKLQENKLTKIETDAIWNKKIIGNKDIDIADLIQKLNITDWVNEGRKFLKSDSICPFCQQKTISIDFTRKLNNYFSGEYENDIMQLNKLKTEYEVLINELINNFRKIEESEKDNLNTRLDISIFSDNIYALENILRSNQIQIANKIKEPSRSMSLNDSNIIIDKLINSINNANEKIIKNNLLVTNYITEKANLIADTWSLLVKENKKFIDNFIHKYIGLNKGLNALENQLNEQTEKYNNLLYTHIEKTKNVTSVQPSVDEINNILKSYDFKGFKIVPSSKENYYQIKREDGTIATETLSEGEITFITFLYFFQLVKGSLSKDNINENRIIVIDDPISSLDSNILFLVSSLIKSLIKELKSMSKIKQIFILTHNVYFHKETSFIDGRTKENHDTYYWILRKLYNNTFIICYKTKNPISTSYELLWQELKENKNLSCITIQNIMRRIIENYFQILGGYSTDYLIEQFPEQEQIICRSLICWINDGSHGIPEDLYIDNNDDTYEKYFSVFKQIFEKTNHLAHFNMMMKEI
ncbi:MAG: AAA family ATPase [Eubacteriaceae bacterium]